MDVNSFVPRVEWLARLHDAHRYVTRVMTGTNLVRAQKVIDTEWNAKMAELKQMLKVNS